MDITSITQDQIFVKKEKESLKQAEASIGNKPPGKYIPVNLDSLGKLSAPKTLHFRNYTMEEAIELSEAGEENFTEVLVNTLNKMVWEDFDCGYLHQEEMKEVMLTVYGSFWSNTIEGYRYYVNLDLKGEERESKENKSVATIPIASIDTIPLSEEFQEPITIKVQDQTVQFILPRMRNSFISKQYIKEKYKDELRRFSNLESVLRFNEKAPEDRKKSYDVDEYEEYQEFLKQKSRDMVRVYEAQLLYSIDGKVLESLEEKAEALKDIPLTFWKIYHNTVEESCQFGINPMVTFECSIQHQPITRRFLFRFLDFVPTMDSEVNTEYTVSFG